MTVKLLEPTALMLDGVDLKAAAGTTYQSKTPINARNGFRFNFFAKVTNSGGGSAGEVKITARSLDHSGCVVKQHDIVTAIPTNVEGETQVDLTFGAAGAPQLFGAGELTDDVGRFEVVFALDFVVTVVTPNDGTSSTLSAWLFLEK